jgi:hypothetical protein
MIVRGRPASPGPGESIHGLAQIHRASVGNSRRRRQFDAGSRPAGALSSLSPAGGLNKRRRRTGRRLSMRRAYSAAGGLLVVRAPWASARPARPPGCGPGKRAFRWARWLRPAGDLALAFRVHRGEARLDTPDALWADLEPSGSFRDDGWVAMNPPLRSSSDLRSQGLRGRSRGLSERSFGRRRPGVAGAATAGGPVAAFLGAAGRIEVRPGGVRRHDLRLAAGAVGSMKVMAFSFWKRANAAAPRRRSIKGCDRVRRSEAGRAIGGPRRRRPIRTVAAPLGPRSSRTMPGTKATSSPSGPGGDGVQQAGVVAARKSVRRWSLEQHPRPGRSGPRG